MAYRVAIVQSNYIPWKGYFDLIDSVDEFVLLDDVQYTKRNWRNRNQIKTAAGLRWLTVPVASKNHRAQRIDEIEICDPSWARSHWDAIAQAYRHAPGFAYAAQILRPAYEAAAGQTRLSVVNHSLLSCVCAALGITTPISWSTDHADAAGLSEKLLAICGSAGASEYVSGPTARAYLDVELFARQGIAVSWFDYSGYPEYPQVHPPFTHQVSVVDLLSNAGARSRHIFRRGGRWLPDVELANA